MDGLRKAGRVDGVYLSLHGAMGVDGVGGPERSCSRRRARWWGSRLSWRAMTCTRTSRRSAWRRATRSRAPDEPAPRSRARGAAMRGDVDRHAARARAPGGRVGAACVDPRGREHDRFPAPPPMLDVFLRMKWMERDHDVLGTSVNMCHPWNRPPALGWSTAVVTNHDVALAERLRGRSGRAVLGEAQATATPRSATAEDAVRRAKDARIARRLGVVMIADASDVVARGGAGREHGLAEGAFGGGERGGAHVVRAFAQSRGDRRDLGKWRRGARSSCRSAGSCDPKRGEALSVRGRLQTKKRLRASSGWWCSRAGTCAWCSWRGRQSRSGPRFRDLGLESMASRRHRGQELLPLPAVLRTDEPQE